MELKAFRYYRVKLCERVESARSCGEIFFFILQLFTFDNASSTALVLVTEKPYPACQLRASHLTTALSVPTKLQSCARNVETSLSALQGVKRS